MKITRLEVNHLTNPIGYYLDPEKGRTIPGKEKIIDQLRVLVKYSDDPEIADFAAKLIPALD